MIVGMSIIIREATEDDALSIIRYLTALSEETDIFINMGAGEFTLTEDEERAFIRQHAQQDNAYLLLAWSGAELVGLLNGKGSTRRNTQHDVYLGMSVARAWRGHGIGRTLLEEMLQWAHLNPTVKRINLQVVSSNVHAIRLYERCGFEREGILKRNYFHHGEYLDSYVMGIWVGDG